ncbi:MAG TPA: hypothetical protein H9662_08570 [Firmicutes bacterium]|nr:hypothetical protein [Bacillota bacterium]
MLGYCIQCRHAGRTRRYRQYGKKRTEREPVLWCEKYHYETSASELHGCFEPEERQKTSERR